MAPQAEAVSTERAHRQQKLIKSCASCHARKVRCDAPTRGLPCSRCADKGETCLLKGRQPRRMRPRNVLVTEFRHAPAVASASPELPGLTNSPHSVQPSQPATNSSPHLTPNLHGGGQSTSSNAAIDSPKTVVASEDTPWKTLNYNNGIHYISILNQAVGQNAAEPGDLKAAAAPQDQATKPRTSTEGLDPIDMEYLSRKRVFDLPPQPYLDKILRLYFEFVYPYAPVLNRCQFMRDYREGCYSVFLMQAVLTSAIAHAPEQVIQACGFSNSCEAQQSFFAKATLLSDFCCEKSQLHLLQGSLILGTAIVPHAKDKDFHFWFYNSVRLALGMELHKCSQNPDSEKSKLFKRMWCILYTRDIILSLFGTQNVRLLSDKEYDVGLYTEQDWEVEHLSEQDLVVLPVALPQHRMFFIEYCRMAAIGWDCLSAVKDHREDPEVLTQRVASWRLSLPEILVHDRQTPDNIWSTVLLAVSYRFECILLRLLRIWWRPRNTYWYEWTKKKLHSAMFELDTITGRTWSNGMLATLPISFKSCIHTALAIHIELVLDDSELEVDKTMSLLSIQRGMLLLKQLKEEPALQQAIPLFEKVLVQKNLISCLSTVQDQTWRSDPAVGMQVGAVSLSRPSSNVQIDTALTAVPTQDPLLGDYGVWFKDFLGFDFLDT